MSKKYNGNYRMISILLVLLMIISPVELQVTAAAVAAGTPEDVIPSLSYHAIPGEGEYESIHEHLGEMDIMPVKAVPLPAKYNPLELEAEMQYLPPTRSQSPYGSCWAHSIMAAAEIGLAKSGKAVAKDIDLSELQLAYFMYNSPETDPLGLAVGDSNYIPVTKDFMNCGGNVDLAKKILQGWISAAEDEGELAYSNAASVVAKVSEGEKGLEDWYAFANTYHLQNYYNININDADDVKKAIQEYGAVVVSYFDHDNYRNTEEGDAYYYTGAKKTNHGVAIVGWDDDYPADKFKKEPSRDGAWLIRNSWYADENKEGWDGTYRHNTYFWMSYDDESLTGCVVLMFEPADNYSNNYHYDGGAIDTIWSYKSGTKIANVFTADGRSETGRERLEAVSFEAVSTNVDYKIEVYKNLSSANDPESGTLCSSVEGSTTYEGYYTVPLTKYVVLEKGDTFAVVITVSHADDSIVKIPQEITHSYTWVSSTVSANPGESFVNYGTWKDAGIAEGKGNFRIKAFTQDMPVTCRITYELNGGTNHVANPSVFTTDGEDIELYAAKKAGYDFAGWYTDAAFDADSRTTRLDRNIIMDTMLYAKWTPITYSIVYHGNEGAVGSMEGSGMTYDKEAELSPNAFTKSGYEFAGWNTAADGSGTSYADGQTVKNLAAISGAEVHLYALWTEAPKTPETPEIPETPETPETPAEHTVKFDLMGRGGTIAPVTVAAGTKLTMPVSPKVIGYLLIGWYKDASLNTAWDFASDTVTGELTLYAKWEEDRNTVTPEDEEDDSYDKSERISLKSVSAKIGNIKGKVYDGNAYMPTVKVTALVKGKNEVLTEGVDYRVLYENNVNAGTGTVIVRGNGLYDGEITANFTVDKKPIGKLKVMAGGMAKNSMTEPPVYVYDGSVLLKSGVDYNVTVPSGMTFDKGKKDVTITAAEQSNYSGSRTVKVMVYDAEKVINDDDVILQKKSMEYTGKALKPEVIVKYDGVELDEKSYSVKYTNNKEAGIAYVTVTGKKGYQGCVVKTFEITPLAKKFELKKSPANATYNGKLQKPKVTVTVDGKILKAGKDYILFYSNNLHASMAGTKATVTVKGKGNYADTAKGIFTFEILPQKISKVSVKGTRENLTLTYAKRVLREGKDYRLVSEDERNGKVELTIEGMGDFTGKVMKKVKK